MSALEPDWIQQAGSKLSPDVKEAVRSARVPAGAKPMGMIRQIWQSVSPRRLPLILRMVPDCPVSGRRSACRELSRKGCRNVGELPIIHGVSAEVPLETLKSLVKDRRISRIALDRWVQVGLERSVVTLGAPTVWKAGWTGKAVRVAVIDTGIAPHPDFTQPRNRLVAFRDLLANRSKPYDNEGHGTMVAGIVAGNGFTSNGRYRGVAPEADLVGVKVLDRYGRGRTSTVIQGIQWVIEQRRRLRIRVVCLSLGTRAVESYREDPLAQAAAAAWEAGLVVCVAAGNDGPEPRTITTPGIHPRVITVGATEYRSSSVIQSAHAAQGGKNPTDPHAAKNAAEKTASDGNSSDGKGRVVVADYSSRGPTWEGILKPDVVAPGTEITSTAPIFSWKDRNDEAKAYRTASGTSFAAPACCGVAALLLERMPDLTPDDVKFRLQNSAIPLGWEPEAQGCGLIQAPGAVLGTSSEES